MSEISFVENDIIVKGYKYPPSSCYPDGMIHANEVIDISPMYPVTARLRSRDVLFVSKEQEPASRAFADRNHIPIVHRYDPWSFVLEPFLDTVLSRADRRRVAKILSLHGISRMQCWKWRRRFKRAMYSYNFESGLWEWGDLGATDLLNAHMGILAEPKYRLNEREFADLYELVISVLFDAVEIPTDEFPSP